MRTRLYTSAQRLRILCWSYPTEPTELLLSVLLMGWGAALLFPENPAAAMPFSTPARLTGISVTIWGMLAVVCGLAFAIGLLGNMQRLRQLSIVSTGMFFGFIAAGGLVLSGSVTGISTYSVLALTTALVYVRRTLP